LGLSWAMMATVLNSEGKKRGRLETEMTIANNIQRSLLPSSPFKNSWCTVTGLAIPTSEVGGDYFDVIPLSDTQVGVIIADVSGHGVGAGIISAMTKSALHSEIIRNPEPSKVLSNLNRTLVSLTEDKTFVTCAYVLMNHRTSTALVATAGHPPVLFKKGKDSRVTEIRTPNLALGVKDGIAFKEKAIRFHPGDILFLHTDGITEAANKKGEQFGHDRLAGVLRDEKNGADICASVIDAAREFTGLKEFEDDATAVGISITPPGI